MSRLGERLIQSAKEARAIARGEMAPARAHVPGDIDAKAIRKKLGLTQADFSSRFGIPKATLRDWEQRRRRPEGSARVLLKIIEREPEAVQRALAQA